VKRYQKERIEDGEVVFQMSAQEMEEKFGITPS
jgi:hypothetical protein